MQLAGEAFAGLRAAAALLPSQSLAVAEPAVAQGPAASRWAVGSGIWSSRHTDVRAALGSLPTSRFP